MEKAIDSATADLKEEAKVAIVLDLVEQTGCSIAQAQDLVEEPEYEDVVLEKMIELKEKGWTFFK